QQDVKFKEVYPTIQDEYEEHKPRFHIQETLSTCDAKEYMKHKTRYYYDTLQKKHDLDITFQYLHKRNKLKQYLLKNPQKLSTYNFLYKELNETKNYILSNKLIDNDILSITDRIYQQQET